MTRGTLRGFHGPLVALAGVVMAAGAVAAGGAMSCGTSQPAIVDFSETPREYQSKDYEAVYDRWTRHDIVRRDYVDAALEVWVTFKSWDFREAYVEHYAGVYGMSDADKSTLRAAQLESSRNAYEFHIAAQSARYKWNDLEKRSSPWRVTLIDGLGHEMSPDPPLHLEKLPDAYEIEFFPAKTPFTRTYLARFPKVSAPAAPDAGAPAPAPAQPGEAFVGARAGRLTLRIASPLGHIDLVWQGDQ